MKLLPLILSLTLIGAPAYATPGGEGNNGNCNGVGNPNSPCNPRDGGSNPGNPGTTPRAEVTNRVSSRNTNTNTVSSRNRNRNTNRQGQSQGQSQGQTQGQTQGQSLRSNNVAGATGGSSQAVGEGGRSQSNSGSASSSTSSAQGGTATQRLRAGNNSVSVRDNSVNNNTYYDERETPLAPLLDSSDQAVLDGVVVPLPSLGISGFATRGDALYGDRDDYGVSLGFRVPIGYDKYDRAARRRDLFRATQEALVMRKQGILDPEAHPEHYEALYGPVATSEEPSTEELPIRR